MLFLFVAIKTLQNSSPKPKFSQQNLELLHFTHVFMAIRTYPDQGARKLVALMRLCAQMLV
jgi:hypothetical protein